MKMEIKVFFSRHGRCVFGGGGVGVRERKGLLLKSDPRVSVDGRALLSFGRLYFLGVLWRNVFLCGRMTHLKTKNVCGGVSIAFGRGLSWTLEKLIARLFVYYLCNQLFLPLFVYLLMCSLCVHLYVFFIYSYIYCTYHVEQRNSHTQCVFQTRVRSEGSSQIACAYFRSVSVIGYAGMA